MTGTTRRSVLAAVGLGLGLGTAGCLTDPRGVGRETGEPTTTGATTRTTTEPTTTGATTRDPTTDRPTTGDPTTGATTGDWIAEASNSPDPDHDVVVGNDAAESRTLRVAVVREATGRTVFETTAELPPGGERVVYNLREADPDGVETFRVCAELVGAGAATATDSEREGLSHRDCATVDTSECYGDAYPTLREDGSVRIVYAIC